jgi:predicted nucleotidyltransferase
VSVDFPRVFETLGSAGVEFILVGGAAATAHGSPLLTRDVDITYRRTRENVAKLAAALAPFQPYLRGAPPGLPFVWNAETLWRGLNFTLITTLGDVDLLGEVTGGGRYEDLLAHCVTLEVFGHSVRCLDLEMLVQVKRAAGRPKDFEAIAQLEAILEERKK